MGKKKDLCWVVPDGNSECLVQCVDNGNKYELYADGDHLTTVWKKQDLQENIEQDIRVGETLCQFVVYDGVPDISLNGILLHADEEFLKQLRKNRRYDILTGVLMTTIGMLAIYFFIIMKLDGEEIMGGWLALVMAVGFTAWGFWTFVSALFRKIIPG